jgi:hypothetical protein
MTKDPDDPGTLDIFGYVPPLRRSRSNPTLEKTMPRFSDYNGSAYMTASELKPLGKHYPAVIRRIVVELVGRNKEEKLAAYLTDQDGAPWRKPVILNKGNREILMQAFGDDIDDCANKKVEVWTELTSHLVDGKPVPGFKFAPAAADLDDEIPPFD